MGKINFDFKDIDLEGLKTLQAIENAENFNEWMYSTIKPYTYGRVLEIGSGIGNISKYFLKSNQEIYLSDIRENYQKILENNFAKYDNLCGIINLDIIDPDFDTKFYHYFNFFDSVFALNVIEHIDDDSLAIRNIKKLLKPGGSIIILVPAFQALYNRLDKELYHFRRYNSQTLYNLFINNEFEVTKCFYFNFIGIFGWYLSGYVQQNKLIPERQINLYNKLVPLCKIADKILLNKLGLSVICIGRKNKI